MLSGVPHQELRSREDNLALCTPILNASVLRVSSYFPTTLSPRKDEMRQLVNARDGSK